MMTIFILTIFSFHKILKTKLVLGLHISSSVAKFTYKIVAILKPFPNTLHTENLESHLR